MKKLAILFNRIYSDYLLPDRLNEYEDILKKLKEHGYKSITLREYKKLLDNKVFSLLGEKREIK